MVFSCGILAVILLTAADSSSATSQDAGSIDTLRQMGKAFARIAEQASPAVVAVKSETVVTEDYPSYDYPGMPRNPFGRDPFEDFYRSGRLPRRQYRQMLAQGSGFLISADGFILTNNHVAGEAGEVKVQLADNREFTARVVGTDPDTDIAVIKIDSGGLPYLELADSDRLEVGEWVVAIGNPFGLSHTVTAGIVSAKGRNNVGLTTYQDFIQTDAAINPGNSGGPLINLDGKVIGINTCILSSNGGNMGIGFAIPVNMAKSIYDQIGKGKSIIRGFLGVSLQDMTAELAKSFDMKDAKGVLIVDVTDGSPADKAGLKQGDVAVEFNGQPVDESKTIQNKVAMLQPGTKAEIAVIRGGEKKKLVVELGERPRSGGVSGVQSDTMERLGFAVQNLTDDMAQRLGFKGLQGVVVSQVDPSSVAARKGISPGMLIQQVNRRPVADVKQFDDATADAASKAGAVLLLVRDDRYSSFITLPLQKK